MWYIQIVELTTAAWKKLHSVLLDSSDFHVIDNLSMAVHGFARHILMSLSVDEMLLPRYMKVSTNFREPPFRGKMSPSWLKHLHFILSAFTWRPLPPAACSRLCSKGISLGRCICKKHYIICVVCVYNSFCGVLFTCWLF